MLPDLFDLPRPPRPRAALPWTEERLRHLRRRWKQGARAREIGAELGVSANAVIAKIHRLGIARLSPYGGAPGRRQKLQNIPRAARPQYVRRRAFSLHRVRPAPPLLKAKRYLEYARLDAQIPIAQRRSLLALSEANCRWPVGKPGSPSFFFCGAQVLRNKPYCAAHCARAYLRPRPPRPRDDRVQRSGGGRGGGCPHPQPLPTSLRSGGGEQSERAAR
ncbi:MAG: GcrA cell cycle regulator [Alphaproteobacteria bacterium]|nr:MAG: GcrA cell cycle regulator [Alphaproteobacteria bacterium]